MKTIRERFEDKFNAGDSESCWEWTGGTNGAGYGMIWDQSRMRKVLAHRLSYEFENGKIPDGMHIMHSCDNPACVNPAHLSAGTRSDNMTDAAKKGRTGNMRLADASVISLLKDYIAGMGHAELATKYGISVKSVPDFTSGRSRAWLHGKHGCPTLEELKSARNMKPGAKISEVEVKEIKRRLAAGDMGKDIAADFGIHKATVSDIKLGKIWKDI